MLFLIYYVTAYSEDVKILCPKGSKRPIKDVYYATIRFGKKMQKISGHNFTTYDVREYINLEVNNKYINPEHKIEISNEEIFDKDFIKVLCVDGFDKYRKDCTAFRKNQLGMPITLENYVKYSMTEVLSGLF